MTRYIFLKPNMFDKWVKQMNNVYEKDYRYVELIDDFNLDCIAKFTYIRNIDNGNVFFSKCNKMDEYNHSIGIAVAYAKATSHKIAVKVKEKVVDPNKLMLNDTIIVKFMYKDKMETLTLNEDKLRKIQLRFDLLDYCYLID